VSAEVEAVAVALDGASDAADDGIGLDDGADDAVAAELVGGGEAGGAAADDEDVSVSCQLLVVSCQVWGLLGARKVFCARVGVLPNGSGSAAPGGA